jgi:hypothetical protein
MEWNLLSQRSDLMRRHTTTVSHRRVARGALSCLALALSLFAVGCGDLLNVSNPGQIADEDLNLPQAVGPMVAGVAGDFALANRAVAVYMGLYANEVIHTGSFPSWRTWEPGRSRRPSSIANEMFNTIARAVWVADNTAERLENILEDASSRHELAEVLMWGGFARFFYADNFCQATFDGGPPVSPNEIYQQAEEILTRAIAVATAAGANDLRLAAVAGRARARLWQGDFTGARNDAMEIPAGFSYNIIYSRNSGRENNWWANYTRDHVRREAGVHPEFYEDPRYQADPRTPFLDRGPGTFGPDEIRHWVEQEKFVSRASPMPVVNWREARLIEAEAELSSDLARAVELIDELRTSVGLDPYDGPVTADDVWEQLLYERSAELWLQGRLWQDKYRNNHPWVAETDGCVEIGQREWETNQYLGGGGG